MTLAPLVAGVGIAAAVLSACTSSSGPTPNASSPTPSVGNTSAGDGESSASIPPPGPSIAGARGTYVVGRSAKPGTYTSGSSPTGECSWARLGMADGKIIVIQDGKSAGPSTVTIEASDKFFQTIGCANWFKTG